MVSHIVYKIYLIKVLQNLDFIPLLHFKKHPKVLGLNGLKYYLGETQTSNHLIILYQSISGFSILQINLNIPAGLSDYYFHS